MKALVLGSGTMAFLAVVRSLGRAGIEVHVAWFEEREPALRSRHIAAAHRIPAYAPGETAWKDELIRLMRREAFDLVIPCDDERGLPLAAHREELEREGRIALPAQEALDVLSDKLATTRLARSLGVPVPDEVVVPGPADDRSALRERFALPVILKPPRSYLLEDLAEKRRVRRAHSWEEADLLLDDMLAEGPVAIQELCRGVGIGVELLTQEGRPLLAFSHERLHEPLEGGGSSYRRGRPVSGELLDHAVAVLAALRYTGVAMVEFKCDPVTGRAVLLEVNARFWGSLPLALAAGVDFPLALFRLLVEGDAAPSRRHRPRLAARNLGADARWHFANLRADRHDPTLNSRPWGRVVRETAANLILTRERNDTLTLDDPAPALAEAGALAREIARTGRIRATVAASARRRRRLGAAARSRLGGGRLLFVCQGNIARSPFAAAIAGRALGDGHAIASAGFLRPGRPSPAEAVQAAADWDVDLRAHRSRTVSPELVRSSDAIFVFDYRNYSDMVRRFPEARRRILPFGALDDDGPLFVEDPWGLGAEAYAETYRRIAQALEPR